jgi:hypothetical protein
MLKQILHNLEAVLDLRPDAGFDLLHALQLLRPAMHSQRMALTRAQGHMPVERSAEVLFALVVALTVCVGEDVPS